MRKSLLSLSILAFTLLSVPNPARGDGDLVPWKTREDEALKLAREKKLPVMIDFAAEWCGACKEIDKITFHDAKVVEKLKGFVPVRLDVTNDTPATAALLKKYDVLSLPAIVFINKEGKILEKPRISGVVPTASFLATLDGIK